ncbi:MAG: phosphoribosylaminoimidazole carboxylase, PurE protein [Candidatus Saccharibacteria bacterium]|nr:phosphoribosylaminoimidazole carboxylase, PurE protein [Candidatus Saccharibacteria bacterium]
MATPLIGIIMGSDSDLDIMSGAAAVLDDFGVEYEVRVISAHRTPEEMMTYAAEAKGRGLKVIIAGAGGSAHLPGMTASHTPLPVIAVPVKRDNHDHEALWSSIKMPPGIPLATLPENGAKNAGLMAIEILSLLDEQLAVKYDQYKQNLHDSVLETDKKLTENGWKAHLASK